jgi:large subunit ribosomal protein L3
MIFMSNGMLGKKLGMTTLFMDDGTFCPVTVIQAGPCTVTQVKTRETDGYEALQLAFGSKKMKNTSKAQQKHFKKSGGSSYARVKEFRLENSEAYTPGQQLTVAMFTVGERVDIVGTTKGRGFTGVVKRHGFAGGKDTHGCRSHRVPGSIGASATPSRVMKGKKMPGQYGHVRQMVRRLKVVDIRPDENLLLIKGAVPGAVSGFLEIRKQKFLKTA